MKKVNAIQVLLLSCLLLFFSQAFATITISSVNVTGSTCANNGEIEILALSSTPIFYEIDSGAEIRPQQSGNIFAALPSGRYRVMLTNLSNDTAFYTFTISGSYSFPDFTSSFRDPICVNTATGYIIGKAIMGLGKPPYTWELTELSSGNITTQTSDTFFNLLEGNYRIRLYDSCQAFATRSVTLIDPSTIFSIDNISNRMISCDTVEVSILLLIPSGNISLPIVFEAQSANGIIYLDTIDIIPFPGNLIYGFNRKIGGLSYGDSFTITITNGCGEQINFTQTLPDFVFPFASFNSLTDSCNVKFLAGFSLPFFLTTNNFSITTAMHTPVTIKVWDNATNILVQDTTINDPFTNYAFGVFTKPLISNNFYRIQITDVCGNNYQNVYQWPVAFPPSVTVGLGSFHCLDSTVDLSISCYSFPSGVTLEILSGPSSIGSTKPNFAHSNTINYPIVLQPNASISGPPNTPTAFGQGFLIASAGIGTYKFRITDSCGFVFNDSIVIRKQDVFADFYDRSFTKGCPGENTINYAITPILTSGYQPFSLYNNQNVPVYSSFNALDTIYNLDAGNYYLEFKRELFAGYYHIDTSMQCKDVIDTIFIPPYLLPKIAFATQIKCNGRVSVGLQPDTSRGVPPYSYEIISGPQTATVQASNFFEITRPGNYIARISDVCGFASTFAFFADTLEFQEILKIGSSCLGDTTILICESSSYATYTWLKPNGQTYIGDTLKINAVASSDYGIYLVQKIVDVNGCRDTFYADYLLTASVITNIDTALCNGESIVFGGMNINVSGTYYDTISTAGCDSIIALTIQAKRGIDTVSVSICKGRSITVGTKIYSTTGAYLDTFAIVGSCDSIRFLNLQVLDVLRDTINPSICYGQSFNVGTNTYNITGTYIDTITSIGGCDSVIILNLLVLDILRDTINESICYGQSYTMGTISYSSAGTYTDTVMNTLGCDSVIILNLLVLDIFRDTINESICYGQSYTLGTNSYSSTGIYTDTVMNTIGCDSIIVLNLLVLDIFRDTINESICYGQSYVVGTNSYSVAGTYTDTVVNTNGCDSVVLLNLEVLPLEFDSVSFNICDGNSVMVNNVEYNQQGIYYDTIYTSPCYTGNVIDINILSNPEVQINVSDDTVDYRDTISLQAVSTTAISYQWQSNSDILSGNNAANINTLMLESSWFYLQVNDSNNCIATDSVFVEVRACDGNIFAPNAFTPNTDGNNDVFKIFSNCINFREMYIYNRWGEKIWHTSDMNTGWDGTYKGVLQNQGVFVYVIYYQTIFNRSNKMLKGSVTLIR
jgi:gliding motility-associated-like protein